MKRIAILAVGVLALVAAPVAAQDQLTSDPTLPTTRTGTRGAAFLGLGVGARAQAMAGAYTALADDISALYWNTAGIGNLEGFTAGFSSSALYADLDLNHTYVGAVLPVGLSRVGLSINMLSSGEMYWADESFPNPGPYGEDFNPTRTTFEWNSMAVGLHYARPITDRLTFGGAGKLITEGINNASASFFGADLGARFETGLYGLTLGATLQNIGSNGRMEGVELTQKLNTSNSETQIGSSNRILEFQTQTMEVELPTAFRFSVMASLIGDASSIISPNPDNNLRLVWDLSDAVNTDLMTAVGLEYAFRDMAFLRVGKQWANEAQISYDFTRNASLGGGLRVPVGDFGRVMLDYAYTAMGDLDNVQVFSIQVGF